MLRRKEFIIMQHYLESGLSKTAIANKLGINRRTVHRYLKSGKTAPEYRPRPPKPSLLDPFKGYVVGRLGRLSRVISKPTSDRDYRPGIQWQIYDPERICGQSASGSTNAD